MIVLAKILGGSHSYGLATPESDVDERFLYAHDTVEDIIGLNKNTFVDNRNKTEDVYGSELKHFLLNLRKGNTQALEMLYTEIKDYVEVHPLYISKVFANRAQLIDPDQLYNSLRGYTHNELRLANGERTGDLGSKRKAALEKYGFSPKNFSHLLRLLHCGIEFFSGGDYPVNIMNWNSEVGGHLLDIKTEPGKFTKEGLNEEVAKLSEKFERAWRVNKELMLKSYKFDLDVVNQIVFDIYYPILGKIQATKLGL